MNRPSNFATGPIAAASQPSAAIAVPANAQAVNRLGLAALSEHLAADPNANQAISPVNLYEALALLTQGAEGKTAERLITALGYDTKDALISNWGNLRTALDAGGDVGSFSLALAAALWHAPSLPIDDTLSQRIDATLKADTNAIDFSSPTAVETINRWIAERTHNLIPRLVENLSPTTEFGLTTALAFKADWATSFDKAATNQGLFTAADGTTAEVAMMHRKGADFLYRRDELCEAVMLPYVNPDYAMALALPAEGVTPATLLSHLRGWSAGLDYATRKGQMWLPRVALDTRTDLLERTAAPTIASLVGGPLDLSGLGASWRSTQTAGQAVHAVALRWDEVGTVAAAATAIFAKRSIRRDDDEFALAFNRPFAFALVHRPTRSILLAGVLNDAKAATPSV